MASLVVRFATHARTHACTSALLAMAGWALQGGGEMAPANTLSSVLSLLSVLFRELLCAVALECEGASMLFQIFPRSNLKPSLFNCNPSGQKRCLRS